LSSACEDLIDPDELALRHAQSPHYPNPLKKADVVCNDNHRALILAKGVYETLPRVLVQVVGWLVEQQKVRTLENHLGKTEPRSLATTQGSYGLIDSIRGEEEVGKYRPYSSFVCPYPLCLF